MPQRLAAILVFLTLPGCVIIDVGVTNPIPGLSRVAVVPFRNLTSHPDSLADGRRFAMVYASELQKVPGFEVVPVGVTEVAMLDSGLKVSRSDDLLELARILGVDAVVVGAVTDYDPYYPPRIGLQVEWISPQQWIFSPGVQADPLARKQLFASVKRENQFKKTLKKALKKTNRLRHRRRFGRSETVRGQSGNRSQTRANPSGDASSGQWRSLDGAATVGNHTPLPQDQTPAGPRPATAANSGGGLSLSPALFFNRTPVPQAPELPPDPTDVSLDPAEAHDSANPLDQHSRVAPLPGGGRNQRESPTPLPTLDLPSNTGSQSPAADPQLSSAGTSPSAPLMAYSRFFDGADRDLVAELRDYVELNGDLRGGGWQAYLQRSDDFIRFACHRMIAEMLTLHGGEARRRIVLKLRKYR